MEEHLQNLINKRRAEKCPSTVIAEVHRRIRAESRPKFFLNRVRVATASFAVILVVLSVAFLRTNEPGPTGTAAVVAEHPEINRRQIIHDAELSFASLGHVLIAAGQSSEHIISKQILPPLQGGLQTIKNKLENQP